MPDIEMRKKYYRINCIALALMLLASSCAKAEKPASGSQAVIKAGPRSITIAEFEEAFKRVMPLTGANMDRAELKALRADYAMQLAEEELILAEAAGMKLAVTGEELSKEIEAIKTASNGESIKESVVGRYGSVDNWLKEIKRKLLIKKTVDAAIGQRAAVTEGAARLYYKEHTKEFDLPEQARARMIVVDAEDEARNLRKRLTPENFAEIARQSSLSPEKSEGGDLGFFAKGEMPKEFEDAVWRLKAGEISPVVKTQYGFHIFLLVEKRKPTRIKFSDVRDRVMERLGQEAGEAEFSAWLARLKKTQGIEIKEELL